MLSKKYKYVFSLGCNCACAEYLRKRGLRLKAGPFDWVLAPNAQAPFEILADHLRFITPADNWQYQPEKAAHIATDIYLNERTGYLFFHDFIAGQSLQTQLCAVQEKYARRVSRMQQILRGREPVLLVWYGETGFVLADDYLRKQALHLRQLYGNHIDFLVLQYGGSSLGRATLLEGVERVCLPKERFAERNPAFLQWDKQSVSPELGRIRLIGGVWNRSLCVWNRCLRILVRIVCWFIWDKQKRHALVEKILH